MKNYIVKPGTRGMFSVDTENVENVDVVETINSHIDWIYRIPENGVVMCEGQKKDVVAGDLVIMFYKSPYCKNIAIVVHNDEWNENILLEKEYNHNKLSESCTNEYCPDCAESPC